MRVISSLGLFFLWAAVAAAQTPLGPEFVPADLTIDASGQGGASVACDETSVCALVWASFKPNGVANNSRQWARTLSPTGELSAIQLLRADEGIGDFTPLLSLNPGFALFSQSIFPGRVFVPNFRFYDEALQPQSDFILQPYHEPSKYGDPDSISFPGDVAVIPGGFAEIGFGFDQPQTPCPNGSCVGVFLFFFDREGKKLHERVQVNEDSSAWEEFVLNNLAVDGTGNLIVTFHRIYNALPSEGSKVFARRFSPAGVPLGPEIEVAADLPAYQLYPVVAASPDGQFLIAWLNRSGPQTDFGEIYGRRFGADGMPLGPAFLVSDPIPGQASASVSADRQGNYFVAWNSLQEFGYDVRGRLYRHDGRPVAPGFRVNQDATYDQLGGLAAFAPNGTLTISYGTVNPSQTHGQQSVPLIRRYAASPGQEPCAVAGPHLLCDTGRTGGALELDTSFGGRPGEVTLLGDWDGDGRDDVCAWLAGRFRCDLDHEGAPAETAARFGFSNDVPLLGDVDGDGRAEPCVRRKRRLLCDTGHNGGRAETTVVLGSGTEVPLLGDLDGDGKDDLCLFHQGQWLCKTRQDAVIRLAFGSPGDLPALGDLDRDGRADLCLLRSGTLLCDTARDGGGAEQSLEMSLPPGARPLFGNLDGL